MKEITKATSWYELKKVWDNTRDQSALLGVLDAIPKILPQKSDLFYTEEYLKIPGFLLDTAEWIDDYEDENPHYTLGHKAYMVLTTKVLDRFLCVKHYLKKHSVCKDQTELVIRRLLEFFGRPYHQTPVKEGSTMWQIRFLSDKDPARDRLKYFIAGIANILDFHLELEFQHSGEIISRYNEAINRALISARMFSDILAHSEARVGIIDTLKEAVCDQVLHRPDDDEDFRRKRVIFSDLPPERLDDEGVPKQEWMIGQLGYPNSKGFHIAQILKSTEEMDTLRKILLIRSYVERLDTI